MVILSRASLILFPLACPLATSLSFPSGPLTVISFVLVETPMDSPYCHLTASLFPLLYFVMG